jgi:hypothetical protein
MFPTLARYDLGKRGLRQETLLDFARRENGVVTDYDPILFVTMVTTEGSGGSRREV